MSRRPSADARTPEVQAFLKWLESSPHLQHLSWYSRFRAAIELWFAAVCRDEATYQERVKELSPEAVRDGMTEHFSKLWLAMMRQPQDLLGEAYQAYSCGDRKNLAQYFTPDPVAECMAKMSVGDLDDEVFRKPGGCRLLEPACGSGVMMIHAVKEVYLQHGQWACNRTQVVMCDLDLLCVRMAGLQMSWLPFPVASVVLQHGDSIRGNEKVIAMLGRGVAPSFTRVIRKAEPEAEVLHG